MQRFGATSVLTTAALVTSLVIGCRLPAPSKKEPMGKLPSAVTSAVPQWIPFQVLAGKTHPADPRERRLANLRQLTDDDHSGGAVWHPDGHSIVFERRTAQGCGQLFRLELESGETELLSPASGWASAASFADGQLLFAFAADAQAPCLRGEPTAASGLMWSLPRSDIWTSSRALITSPSYDGELASANDGSLVFTSTRDGDPELYVAGPDGNNVARITRASGYDGRASFSPDGSKLVWQAERLAAGPAEAEPAEAAPDRSGPDGSGPVGSGPVGSGEGTQVASSKTQSELSPRKLSLQLAGNRGQHAHALPPLGTYDITPTFLPDSQRILFASDYDQTTAENGYGFEIYILDPDAPANGNGKPVVERVTYQQGFDGDARVSRDGHWIVFTSSRNAKQPGGTNVFVARWLD